MEANGRAVTLSYKCSWKKGSEMIIGHLHHYFAPRREGASAKKEQLDCLTEKKSKQQGGCQSGEYFQLFTTTV